MGQHFFFFFFLILRANIGEMNWRLISYISCSNRITLSYKVRYLELNVPIHANVHENVIFGDGSIIGRLTHYKE